MDRNETKLQNLHYFNLRYGPKTTLMEILSRSDSSDMKVENNNVKKEENPEGEAPALAEPEKETIYVKRTKVGSTSTKDGMATIVTERDSNGKEFTRIEYERDNMVSLAHSPYAILTPTAMKSIVTNMPELIPSLPMRHGVNL